MSHAEQAQQQWIAAKPKVNEDGKVTAWFVEYEYKLNSFTHVFDEFKKIKNPSKTPSEYSKQELLEFFDKNHWDDMFNKKYEIFIKPTQKEEVDNTFDVNSLS
jgi:hypothetical protein